MKKKLFLKNKWIELFFSVLLLLCLTHCESSDDIDPYYEYPDSGSVTCTRQELTDVIDAYLAALTGHDPSTLPVSADVKFTEDGKELQLGQGFWQTAGQVLFHRNLIDPEMCGTVTQAVIEENGEQLIFGLRLKLEDNLITEIETLVVRTGPLGDFSFSPETIVNTPQPEWEEAVPEDERSTREELYAIANLYFDGYETSGTRNYTPVPFADDCNRWENGVKTTNNNCARQFENIPFNILGLGITERRFLVADVENGIAIGFAVFSGMGIDFHMFKVRGGKIHTIQAVVGPYDGETGW